MSLANFARSIEMKLAAAHARHQQLRGSREEIGASLDRTALAAAPFSRPCLRRIAALETEAAALHDDMVRLQEELRLARGKHDRLRDRARLLLRAEERRQVTDDALETALVGAGKATGKQGVMD